MKVYGVYTAVHVDLPRPLPAITPSIGVEPVLSDNPLGAFLGSLTLIR